MGKTYDIAQRKIYTQQIKFRNMRIKILTSIMFINLVGHILVFPDQILFTVILVVSMYIFLLAVLFVWLQDEFLDVQIEITDTEVIMHNYDKSLRLNELGSYTYRAGGIVLFKRGMWSPICYYMFAGRRLYSCSSVIYIPYAIENIDEIQVLISSQIRKNILN